ncbi:unnamed protein product [Aphanomyces euteiches]|uniref:Uncharacterized protein n=1 Tax=Aphanomyces euteiches TaxID=100861 RepID=A0A6G0XUQ9_9STRA|nr:hypothetical protein Ae201684_000802 [Aphanomyces euteiches]KAH9142118.1 hypothetical protein AeRB84_013790 [Aphanomyces euteiches]
MLHQRYTVLISIVLAAATASSSGLTHLRRLQDIKDLTPSPPVAPESTYSTPVPSQPPQQGDTKNISAIVLMVVGVIAALVIALILLRRRHQRVTGRRGVFALSPTRGSFASSAFIEYLKTVKPMEQAPVTTEVPQATTEQATRLASNYTIGASSEGSFRVDMNLDSVATDDSDILGSSRSQAVDSFSGPNSSLISTFISHEASSDEDDRRNHSMFPSPQVASESSPKDAVTPHGHD